MPPRWRARKRSAHARTSRRFSRAAPEGDRGAGGSAAHAGWCSGLGSGHLEEARRLNEPAVAAEAAETLTRDEHATGAIIHSPAKKPLVVVFEEAVIPEMRARKLELGLTDARHQGVASLNLRARIGIHAVRGDALLEQPTPLVLVDGSPRRLIGVPGLQSRFIVHLADPLMASCRFRQIDNSCSFVNMTEVQFRRR